MCPRAACPEPSCRRRTCPRGWTDGLEGNLLPLPRVIDAEAHAGPTVAAGRTEMPSRAGGGGPRSRSLGASSRDAARVRLHSERSTVEIAGYTSRSPEPRLGLRDAASPRDLRRISLSSSRSTASTRLGSSTMSDRDATSAGTAAREVRAHLDLAVRDEVERAVAVAQLRVMEREHLHLPRDARRVGPRRTTANWLSR